MEKNPVFPLNISGINSGQATFQLQGHFEQQAVIWQCTLQTLQHHYQSLITEQEISATENIMLKKFIHIKDESSAISQIHIGLDVDCIDEATIRKTIIMLHNYKNLHAGLHKYGTSYHYPEQ